MKEALFYKKEGSEVRCILCPHNCLISENNTGICYIRKNINGKLYSLNYGKISAIHIDPIEKKPLYNFYSGSKILSIGTYGCNMRCIYCQNWEISQTHPEYILENEKIISPHEILNMALKYKEAGNIGVAYTYNEPIIWYEYVYETAKLIKEKEMKNIMVTNGFINKEPLSELIRYIDAFTVTLKGFTEDFYKNITFSKLSTVKENIKYIKENNKHIEIVHLIVPGLNDNIEIFKEMVEWIYKETGSKTDFHLLRYFPNYKYNKEMTDIETINKFYKIAKEKMENVHIGNVR